MLQQIMLQESSSVCMKIFGHLVLCSSALADSSIWKLCLAVPVYLSIHYVHHDTMHVIFLIFIACTNYDCLLYLV